MGKESLKFIDLFAGIGGFRIALESLGLECVFTSEWDKAAQRTYQANFGELPNGDITEIDEKDIPLHNVLCAGFPCQAFSISGKQKGFTDTRGTLFFDIARIAKYHQPEILFLENVRNFERHDNGNTLNTVLSTLDEIGYNTFFKVINASHYGSPTKRERIYFIAFLKKLKLKSFEFPAPSYEQVKLSDYLEDDNNTDRFIINRKDIKLRNVEIKSDMFGNFPLKPIRIGTINSGGQGERIYSILGHAITLSAYGGGAAAKTGAYLVNGKVRKLSPRECARIMGFPDDFKITCTDTLAFKQFGNSVVVPVVKKIFEEALIKYQEYK